MPSFFQSVETIASIGELALIERLKPFCAVDAIGDDAALLTVSPRHQLVVTTDMLTDGVHFSDRTTPPYAIGWRATTANLSDLAAMGATPTAITISLGLPGTTSWPWLQSLYQGIADCLQAHGGKIIGGDLCRADQRVISITALGEVLPAQAIKRDQATADMSVVVTGPHGGSRAGLAVLLGEIQADCTTEPVKQWIRAHQQPIPRFDAIAHLRQLIPATSQTTFYPPIAGMDSSDGLANALLQLSSSSGIGMDIVIDHIPLPLGLSATVGPKTALNWALYGGEDFELVLCMSHESARQLITAGVATLIGTTNSTGTVNLRQSPDSEQVAPLNHQSFQHF